MIPAGRPVLVYCGHGERASTAAQEEEAYLSLVEVPADEVALSRPA